MARNPSAGRDRAQSGRENRRSNSVGLWTTRTTSSGRFTEAKRSGNVLGGARRED